MSSDHEYLFKIILIGNSNIGKTALLLRFADDSFSTDYISTIGVDFRTRTIKIGSKIVKLQLWDTAGQERFRCITNVYYRGAHGVMLCYDITDMQSFDQLEEWLMEINNTSNSSNSNNSCNNNIIKLVVGNKSDLEDERQVSTDMGESFALKNDCEFIETSAKASFNVGEAFGIIAQRLLYKSKFDSDNLNFTVINNKVSESKRKCCVL